MVLEGIGIVLKEAAKEIAEKAIETAEEIVRKEVKDLPEQIGKLSELEDLPNEIGGEIELDGLPDEIGDETFLEHQENLKDLNETDAPKKKGGSYDEVFKEGEGNKYEVHHMPADSTSNLERGDGPAIKMEKADHRQTASCGSSREAQEYRKTTKGVNRTGKVQGSNPNGY